MATPRGGTKVIGSWAIVCIFLLMVCFIMSVIQRQETYAETKKVSGKVRLSDKEGKIVTCRGTDSVQAYDAFLLGERIRQWE